MKSLNSSEFARSTVNGLMQVTDVADLIRSGAALAIAGPEAALDKLPAGKWIGGTTPYFMTAEGGRVVTDEQLFVTDLSIIGRVSVASYGSDALANISGDTPDRGFSLVIIPAMSHCHREFALEAPNFPDTFLKPVVGWISGFDLDAGGVARAYDGTGPHKHDDRAVVLQVEWDDSSLALPEIVNPFFSGTGDVLNFLSASFVQTECLVNGVRTPLAAYIMDKGLADGQLPLVGDYGGSGINVSLQKIDEQSGEVTFYAPLFEGVDYRFAAPLADYPAAFAQALAGKTTDGVFWSCNCILNFLFGDLVGKKIGGIPGPITFGEIAYQLLNQTMVTVRKI